MSTGGGSRTQTVAAPSQPNPPSLLPEAKEGYEQAQNYYKDILANPPVYAGARIPGIPEALQYGITNLQDIGAGGPYPEEYAARNLTFTTASGGSLEANPYARTYDIIDPSLYDTAYGVYTYGNPYASEADIFDPNYYRNLASSLMVPSSTGGGPVALTPEEQSIYDDAKAGLRAGADLPGKLEALQRTSPNVARRIADEYGATLPSSSTPTPTTGGQSLRDYTGVSDVAAGVRPFTAETDVTDPRLRDFAEGVYLNQNPFTTTRDLAGSTPGLRTTEGGYYLDPNTNPFMTGARANILDPIFERYQTEIAPNIRDRFISAGGEGSARFVLAEEQALRELGRASTNALAGWEAAIYQQERGLQQAAQIADLNAQANELERAGRIYDAERLRQQAAAIESSRLAETERGRATGAAISGAGLEAGERARATGAARDVAALTAGERARAGSVYGGERELQQRAGEVISGLNAAELSRAGAVYANERQLQEQAAANAGAGMILDLMRANTLIGAGQQQRGFGAEQLTAERELFEEPIYRQSAAAQSLMQVPSSAGIPRGSSVTSSEDPGLLGAAGQLGQLALMLTLAGKVSKLF